jgi:predicted HTH transcriptional regulator
VTFYRQVGERNEGSTTPVTTPVTDIKEKIIQIIMATPNISKADIASLCNLSIDGVKYHINKMRKNGLIEWVGNSRNGRWIIKKVE